MGLTIILVFCVPIAFMVLVFVVIGMAGARTYRTARRAYADVKPYINELAGAASRALRPKQSDKAIAKGTKGVGGRAAN